jgi:hypothetical protein
MRSSQVSTTTFLTQISLQEGELDSSIKSIQEVEAFFLDSKIDLDAFLEVVLVCSRISIFLVSSSF